MKILELELEKTKNIPKRDSELWGRSMLSRILTEMSNEERKGCVYAEFPSDKEGFYYTPEHESVIIKRKESQLIIPDQSSSVHLFIGYVIRQLFGLKKGWTISGLLGVKFSDEDRQRHFCVFARRSGKLGDFIQIDQF